VNVQLHTSADLLRRNNSLLVLGEKQTDWALVQVWTFRNANPVHLVTILKVVICINRYGKSARCRCWILKLLFLMYPLVLLHQKFVPSGICLHVFTVYVRYQSTVTELHTGVGVPSKTGRIMNLLMNTSTFFYFSGWMQWFKHFNGYLVLSKSFPFKAHTRSPTRETVM